MEKSGFVLNIYWHFKSHCLPKHNLAGCKENVLFPLRVLLQWVLCTEFMVLEKTSWQHTAFSAHFTFNKIDAGTDIVPWRQGCTQILTCVSTCILHACVWVHVHCMAICMYKHYAFRDKYIRSKEILLLFRSVSTEICNGFHCLLRVTHRFICGLGALIRWQRNKSLAGSCSVYSP